MDGHFSGLMAFHEKALEMYLWCISGSELVCWFFKIWLDDHMILQSDLGLRLVTSLPVCG